MSSLILYTNPQSRGRIARWMLEEVGVPYETVVVDYGTTMKGADYLAVNPMGKVPAIVHDGKVVTECAAICAYLAHVFADAELGPKDDEAADYFRWLFFAAGPIEQSVTNKAAGFVVPEGRERMFGYGDGSLVLDVLDRHLADRAYVCGDRFTAADVYVGAQVGWGMMFGTMDSRPSFEAYDERLKARPGLRRANQLDEALIAQAQPA